MIKYKRIYDDGKVMRYEYYPEGRGKAGIVEFENGEGKIIKSAEEDFDDFYTSHALQIDQTKESGTIAWYQKPKNNIVNNRGLIYEQESRNLFK